MNCINCGKPTVGDAVLCRACAAAQRSQTAKRAPRKGIAILSVALALVTLLAAGLIVYLVTTSDDRAAEKAQMRVSEAELDRRAYALTQTEKENEALTERLSQMQTESDSLRQKINELDSQIGAMDSERNQATSDYIQQAADLEGQLRQKESEYAAAQEQLEKLQEQYDELNEEHDELTEKMEELEEENEELESQVEKMDDLQDRYDLLVENMRNESSASSGTSTVNTNKYLAYKKKADFLDEYIVFVQDDGTGYYHTYDCDKFNSSSFWAYNRSLAKSQGYKPCPRCCN